MRNLEPSRVSSRFGVVPFRRYADLLNGDVARTGGEEFLIILNGPCSPAAMHFAEQIRSAVALIQHPEIGHPGQVTASFGVAMVKPHESSRSALRRADIALYSAKNDGRNCVKAADEISLETRAS